MTSSVTSKPSTANKGKSKSTKATDSNTAKTKGKSKEVKKNTGDGTKTQDKSKVHKKDTADQTTTTKGKKTPNIRTPFDKVLEKLSNCASSSPSLVDVMQENLQELQSDEKHAPLFNAAPHTAAFLNKRSHDSTKFIGGLRQALNADWSNPTWKSWNEIDTLFRPFKQQFVYAMMRFNCT
ncbi:unnamed protein product [Rotaria sp. Silwood2]|nr:unnamed protein product [Rotaria sp. Silwood2]CAF2530463.1 unnamed protein product [Rotaria sp. Silwood2]CAF2942717.1 unnamed protein product [Rotaria sp. Silwood2]CAF3970048.1 unnamed protein product [Rotaria sp. Silwood2]CAF4074807.1 unnamed protein product [Rotaria sp. Silwood2]